MSSSIKVSIILIALISAATAADSVVFISDAIRHQALAAGYKQPNYTHTHTDANLSKIGKALFESKNLSLNGDISCSTCHVDRHGSSDGLPNSVGIGGQGEGIERLRTGGRIIPRNSLALFGVGGKGFNAFFWDGRVEKNNSELKSPFGNDPPSNDPLIVSVHLPIVEIRETLQEDQFVSSYKLETVDAANALYRALLDKLLIHEVEIMEKLAEVLDKNTQDLQIIDVAIALSEHIRDKFKLRVSKFSEFMLGENELDTSELEGALVYYGKGQCVMCHNGPYFSDFNYHTIALPQAGFGKNGFGTDYGRYNSTFNPNDLYKFRTPTLHNVTNTQPYGHSGSIQNIEDVIISHIDPLMNFDTKASTRQERMEFTKIVSRHDISLDAVVLSDHDVENLVSFLKTLQYAEELSE